MITAILCDSREPTWVKELKFGDAPVSITTLDVGDIWVACDDGAMLIVERKTPDDFLNSLREDRLLVQAQHLAEMRKQGYWPYIMITGEFERLPDGTIKTPERLTNWHWSSVQGAMLTIQEMGVPVIHCAGDKDLREAIIRLSNRKRDPMLLMPPMRAAKVLGPAEAMIAAIPGIGVERSVQVIELCTTAAWALCALTDKVSKIPGVPNSVKTNLRHILGLEDHSQLIITEDESGADVLQIAPLGAQ